MKKISKTTLLTIGAVVGVVTTAVSASYGGLKVHNVLKDETKSTKDKIKESIPYYIPTFLSAGITIALIAINQKINRAEIAAILSASGVTTALVNKYRDAIVDKWGEDGLNEVHEIMAEKAQPVDMYAPGLISLNKGLPTNGEVITFHDQYTDKWFESTIPQVLQAEYHLNRMFSMNAEGASLADWLEYLGLENDIPNSDKLCWCGWLDDGIYWLDFDHTKVNKKGGGYYYEISMMFPPEVEVEYE